MKEDVHAMRIRIVETAQKGEGLTSYATYKIQTRVRGAFVA